MKKLLWGTLMVFGLIGSLQALGLGDQSDRLAGMSIASANSAYAQAYGAQEGGAVAPLLLAKSKEQLKCLDQCAKTRYTCEKDNNKQQKIGTEENWKESTKCQQKYSDCMEKCDLS